jgi:PTS system nitrogen regulatory IIA component
LQPNGNKTKVIMKIEEFLAPADVVIDLRASDKEAALRELARRAAAALHRDAQALLQAMHERESLGSTGLGDGIAIPHLRLDGIDGPFGILARLKRPIDFDAVDGKPVDILFFLVLPGKSQGGTQLNALACAARSLRDEAIAKAIRQAPDAEAAYHAIVRP